MTLNDLIASYDRLAAFFSPKSVALCRVVIYSMSFVSSIFRKLGLWHLEASGMALTVLAMALIVSY